MAYVDGFLLPVPKRKLQAYRRMSQKAGKIWREHGALEYRECVGDDLDQKMAMTFPRRLQLNAARPSCSPGSCTSHAPTGIGSSRR
jgi:uncharacterized protein YbaA (DUF1428 family)